MFFNNNSASKPPTNPFTAGPSTTGATTGSLFSQPNTGTGTTNPFQQGGSSSLFGGAKPSTTQTTTTNPLFGGTSNNATVAQTTTTGQSLLAPDNSKPNPFTKGTQSPTPAPGATPTGGSLFGPTVTTGATTTTPLATPLISVAPPANPSLVGNIFQKPAGTTTTTTGTPSPPLSTTTPTLGTGILGGINPVTTPGANPANPAAPKQSTSRQQAIKRYDQMDYTFQQLFDVWGKTFNNYLANLQKQYEFQQQIQRQKTALVTHSQNFYIFRQETQNIQSRTDKALTVIEQKQEQINTFIRTAQNQLANRYGNLRAQPSPLSNLHSNLQKISNKVSMIESSKGRVSPQVEYLNLLYKNINLIEGQVRQMNSMLDDMIYEFDQ